MDWLRKASAQIKMYSLFPAFLLLAFLTACGGGGFDDPNDDVDTGGGTGTEDVVSVVVTISNTEVSAANPATITATVAGSQSGVKSGVVVEFSTTLGVLDPESGTALTDANGQARIQIHPGTVEGAGEVTASISSGESGLVGFTSAGDGSAVGGKVIVLSISNSSLSANAPGVVTALVTDNGVAVTNEVVTFTASLGILEPGSGTALTNDSGEAVITLSAGSVEGAGTVSASLVTGESGNLTFYTAGDAAIDGGRSLDLSISNPSIDAANSRILTATLLDDGDPVVGEVITFSSTLGVLDPLSGTALTDSNGQATVTISAGSVEGAGIVTAVARTGEADTVGFYTAGDGSASDERSLSVALSSVNISNAVPATVTATLLDNGVAVAGEVITFTSTIGRLDPDSGTALTNASGQATIQLNAGSVEGAGILTATTSAGEVDSAGFSTAGDEAGGGITVDLVIDNSSVTSATPRNLTATVRNNGVAVAGEVVTFDVTLGLLDPASGTALTNASGQATIRLLAGTVEGAGVATATTTSGEFNTVGFTTAGDGSSGVKTIDVTIDNAEVDAANPRTLTAMVTENGAAVAGEVVTFSTTLGALNPVSGTALTDGTGTVTMTLTAGSIEGAGLVTARTSTGESDSIGFHTAGDLVSGVGIILDLTDSSGTPLDPRQISTTQPGKIQATVTGISEPVIVTFTSDLGNIPIPTAITNASNVATVDIFAANSLGAGTITATLVTGETAQMVFSIGASSLGIGTSVLVGGVPDDAIEIPGGALSAGGTTSLSVTIWDTSTNPATVFTEAVDVTFSSNCSVANPATAIIDSPVTSVNGVATATYLAQGCEGVDQVTATANAGGVVLSATGTVTVNAASVGSIQFESATPTNIALKGTGGTESSVVLFKVLDSNGNPVNNQLVNFALTTTVGGITLDPASATTNASGFVQTVINAGNIATPVRVRATVDSTAITTLSNALVISTGIPDQDSISLAADTVNPEAWSPDGTTVTVTARLADAFNNPVPDGTAVSFWTEGGSIGSSCTTTAGACSVTWTSQNPRPDGNTLGSQVNNPQVQVINGLGQSYGGRATITAVAVGNESFPDLNGNGLYDSGEEMAFAGNDNAGNPFDLDEAYEDYNEDGVYRTEAGAEAGGELERLVDFDVDGNYDVADNEYNGVLCGTATNCSTTESIHVRTKQVLVMSGSAAFFSPVTVVDGAGAANNGASSLDIVGDGTGSASIIIADLHNQPMPAGTKVEFKSTVGSIVSDASFTWPNDNHNGGAQFAVTVKGETTPKSGSLIVTVTTPGGLATIATIATISIQ